MSRHGWALVLTLASLLLGAFDSDGSLLAFLVALAASVLAGGVTAYADSGEKLPLDTPRIDRLDLRPRWTAHPHRDMLRRGERDWQSGLTLLASGWRPAVPVLVDFARHRL